jgi:capsular exopolysaccharide synthesis family protein
MSKIYDALLRAEIDRAAGHTDPADIDPSGDNPAGLNRSLIEGPGLLSASRDNGVVSNGSSSLFAAAARTVPASSAAAMAAGIDLAKVRELPWNLALPQLPSLEERGSAVEQFRSLRSRMQEFRDLNTLKTILVSSGRPQEGKSFVSANLAVSFARHKSARVLLIDGDMRRGSLNRILGAPNTPGLTEYLSGNAGPMDIMQRAQPDADGKPLPKGLASLTFIPCGADATNASDLSGNLRFAELLRILSPLFDWIIVDSSPVNLVADGVNLARHCDGVLLVARGGVTEFKTAQRAMSELKASTILGFVLNAVPNPPASGGYYGYDSFDKENA